MITQADIDNWFTYHSPTPKQTQIYETIRRTAKRVAEGFIDGHIDEDSLSILQELIRTHVPDGMERFRALESLRWSTIVGMGVEGRVAHLRVAVMWSNVGIACS